jgi:hypothetical protein
MPFRAETGTLTETFFYKHWFCIWAGQKKWEKHFSLAVVLTIKYLASLGGDKRAGVNKNYMSIGASVRTQSPQPAKAVSGFDRKATRNPQLHIVPSVNANHKGCANRRLRQFFGAWQRTFFIRADNFTRRTIPLLTVWILRKSKTLDRRFRFTTGLYSQTVQRFSTVKLFISTEKFKNARQTVSLNDKTSRLDSSAVLDRSAFQLDREI